MERATTCCFTGHRPEKLPWRWDETDSRCLALKCQLDDALEEAFQKGYTHFICGMAQGCDLYFAEAVLALQEKYPAVTLEAARPWEGQCSSWAQEDRVRYTRILDACNYETLVQHRFDRGCLLRRNRYMVDHAALLLAVYDGNPKGGTAYTVLYAHRQGLALQLLGLDSPSENFD